MPRPLWSPFIALLVAVPIFAQGTSQNHAPNSGPEIQAVTVRPESLGPPPADASPKQLEDTGDHLREIKLYNDAIDYYQAALKKKPNSATLYNKIGIAHLEMNRLREAQKLFERAAKLDANFPEPVNNLGVVYYLWKKNGKAIKLYRKAIQIRETSASFHSNLGTAYFAKKEYEKATAEYLRAMELDPDIFERQSMAGVGLRMASPEDRARYAYVMAKLCAQRGFFDRSLLYLKKAIEGGYPGVSDAYKDAEFANLRKDPRFGAEFAEVMRRREAVPN